MANTEPSWTFSEGEPLKTSPQQETLTAEEAQPEPTSVEEPTPEPVEEPVVVEPKTDDAGWWGWLAGGIAALAGIVGTAAVVLKNTKVKPVGKSAKEAAKPTSHTAPEDMSPGDIIRNQLDNRERD
jgi:hypothetical protein